MRLFVRNRGMRLLALVMVVVALGACARGTRTDAAKAPVNVPASFDVTLWRPRTGSSTTSTRR